MCGIFAYISDKVISQNDQDSLVILNKNFQLGKSRGPESSNITIIDNIYLGFHRLAINGLNEASNQPLVHKGIYLICNGEIYNYSYLYKEYSIEQPKSGSDCEVIIHMYLKFGIEYTLNSLDGVFAFVMYDSISNTVIVARDPYGVRPLYYSQNAYASELKQLVGINKEIKYFPPGSYSVNGNIKRYTSFPFAMNNTNNIHHGIFMQLKKAVHKRVIGTTERPIACLLSGGLDSSLITALVNQLLPKGTLETYSIGLPGSVDLKYAKIVADFLGTKHTEILLTEQDFLGSIPEVIKAIESYDTTTVRASVGNYLVGKYISQYSQAKVIFNGDGSDELTGGYLYFNKCPDEYEFDRECKRLLTDIHMYDVLRSDKCISSHGLEPRTPFLDRSFAEYYLSIPPGIRCHSVNKKCEKYLLREAVEYSSPGLLPYNILYRRKEAFSDGVSSEERSWYSVIKEKYSDEKEYYHRIFQSYFGDTNILEYTWMPKYVIASDPSARTLKEYS